MQCPGIVSRRVRRVAVGLDRCVAGLERGLWRASARALGTGRGRRVARQVLKGLRDQEACTRGRQHTPASHTMERARRTFEARSLLALAAEAVPLLAKLVRRRLLAALEQVAHERRGRGARERRAAVAVAGQHALGLRAPGHDGALRLGLLAEDEAEEHVEAAEREEEEGRDEREVVDVVREDRRADEALEDAERAEPEGRPEHGEVPVEEGGGPADLGEDEHEDLEDDEQAVDDRPEDAGGLVRDGAPSVDSKDVAWKDVG